MPIENGVGWSGHTTIKQEHFKYVLDLYIKIVKGILARYDFMFPYYVYIDMTAGPGIYEGIIGSPLLSFNRTNVELKQIDTG